MESTIYVLSMIDYDGARIGRPLLALYFKEYSVANKKLEEIISNKERYPTPWEFLPLHKEYERPTNNNILTPIYFNSSYGHCKILYISKEVVKEKL